jgi:hypothetical protein
MLLLLLQVLAETQGNTSAVPFDQIDKVSNRLFLLVASVGQAAGAAENAVAHVRPAAWQPGRTDICTAAGNLSWQDNTPRPGMQYFNSKQEQQ